jgi:predicted nucleic acid-binding protein
VSAVTTTRKPCLLDTDVLIDYLRRHPKAAALFDKLPDDCAICAISVAELHAGVREGTERDALDTLLSSFTLIEITAEIAAQGGLLRRDWGKSHGVGLNDALIAATALASGRVLLSLNGKHFPMLGKGQLVVPYKKP